MNELTMEELETLNTLVHVEVNTTEQNLKQYGSILGDKVVGYLQGHISSMMLIEYKLENMKKDLEQI